jgi:FtsH-binding integral membrane protein
MANQMQTFLIIIAILVFCCGLIYQKKQDKLVGMSLTLLGIVTAIISMPPPFSLKHINMFLFIISTGLVLIGSYLLIADLEK